jgi:hypothetical protein
MGSYISFTYQVRSNQLSYRLRFLLNQVT